MSKRAQTDIPILDIIADRWSPYGFDPKSLPLAELRSLFEAARWAPSAYNEQPWRYLVALRQDDEAFETMLSCLVEPNQAWAKDASALALGLAASAFARNGNPNGTALHDLGLASAHLTFEATSRGLAVHQMSGILPDRAREVYEVPDDFQIVTALAIGTAGPVEGPLADRDRAERSRRPLSETLFQGKFGQNLGR